MKILQLLVGALLALATGQLIAAKIFSVRRSFDPTFGSIFCPGTTVTYRLEGSGRSTWVAHGFRGPNDIKNNELPRILVLGDSFTEALQVDDKETFVYKAENYLLESGWKGVLLNHGSSSASVADYVAWAKVYADTIHPAWTVIQVREDDFTSDAWNQQKARGACVFFRDPDTQRMLLRKPVMLEPQKRDPLRRAVEWARNRSDLLQYTIRRGEQFNLWLKNEPPLFRASQVTASVNSKSTRTWKDYPVEEELGMLSDAYCGRLTLLFVSDFDPKRPTSSSEFERYLVGLCRSKGISITTTSCEYRALAGCGLSPFGFNNSQYNFGHLNAQGHQVVAVALSKELRRIVRAYGLY